MVWKAWSPSSASWRFAIAAKHCQRGLTILELMIALAILSLLVLALDGVVAQTLQTHRVVHEENELTQQARFALSRMARAVSRSRKLLLPQQDRNQTDWRENVREETVPASPPEGSSTMASAVLAVTMDPTLDQNGDGIPDSDNDGDGLIDEDPGGDSNNDEAPGIYGIDDGGNGLIDEFSGVSDDDDEYGGVPNDDPENGLDDDGDGLIDEDPGADRNGDGGPGVAGVDDDGDGSVDEGGVANDDEDEDGNEDWYDTVVYYLVDGILLERLPVPWDENGDDQINGRDYVIRPLAEQVSRFRVERLKQFDSHSQLVDLTLELSGAGGAIVSLNTRVRLGGAL